MRNKQSAGESKTIHRDFLGAHRYTTRGGMCVLRRPLHGALPAAWAGTRATQRQKARGLNGS